MKGDHKRLCGSHDQPEFLRSNSIPPYTNGYTHRDLIPGECGQVSAFQTTGAYVIKTLKMLICFCHLGMFLSPANTTSRNQLCCAALLVFLFPASSIHNKLLCGTLSPTVPSCGFNGVGQLELFFGQSGFFHTFLRLALKAKRWLLDAMRLWSHHGAKG